MDLRYKNLITRHYRISSYTAFEFGFHRSRRNLWLRNMLVIDTVGYNFYNTYVHVVKTLLSQTRTIQIFNDYFRYDRKKKWKNNTNGSNTLCDNLDSDIGIHSKKIEGETGHSPTTEKHEFFHFFKKLNKYYGTMV